MYSKQQVDEEFKGKLGLVDVMNINHQQQSPIATCISSA
jgi:hypothetical protein